MDLNGGEASLYFTMPCFTLFVVMLPEMVLLLGDMRFCGSSIGESEMANLDHDGWAVVYK